MGIHDVSGTTGNWVIFDGTALPLKDGEFDVVCSNSVIEHLASREAQAAFAKAIRRVGSRYFVQNPDVRFPVEPHYLAPAVRLLPKSWRRRFLRNFTVWGLVARPTEQGCAAKADEIELLSAREVKTLLPHARLVRDRFAGLPNSLVAIGGAGE